MKKDQEGRNKTKPMTFIFLRLCEKIILLPKYFFSNVQIVSYNYGFEQWTTETKFSVTF